MITKLTEQWKTEQPVFAEQDLSEVDDVYLWADGIHVSIRLGEHKLRVLLVIGVRADGRLDATIKPAVHAAGGIPHFWLVAPDRDRPASCAIDCPGQL